MAFFVLKKSLPQQCKFCGSGFVGDQTKGTTFLAREFSCDMAYFRNTLWDPKASYIPGHLVGNHSRTLKCMIADLERNRGVPE